MVASTEYINGFDRRLDEDGSAGHGRTKRWTLGPQLRECAEAALCIVGQSATEVFGSPDDMKLRSCATLFAAVSPTGSVSQRVLDKFFRGMRDEHTLRLIGSELENDEPSL